LSKAASSKARVISIERSPRKLKKTTESPSSIVPTGFPALAMTKGGRSWSIVPGNFARRASIAAEALSYCAFAEDVRVPALSRPCSSSPRSDPW
jgi:hypothetical protein